MAEGERQKAEDRTQNLKLGTLNLKLETQSWELKKRVALEGLYAHFYR
jgi:hypothetical protein